jgi:hypothetical protein
MTKQKTYPNTVLVDALQDMGIYRRLMWEIPGPKNTELEWISCYLVEVPGQDISIIHVVTFKDYNGWDVLVSVNQVKIQETIDEVLRRIKGE